MRTWNLQANRNQSVIIVILLSLALIITTRSSAASAEQSTGDPYRTLGLAFGTGISQVKKAYRKLSLQYHPDKNTAKSSAEKEEAQRLFIAVSTAYESILAGKVRSNQESKRSKAGQRRSKPSWAQWAGFEAPDEEFMEQQRRQEQSQARQQEQTKQRAQSRRKYAEKGQSEEAETLAILQGRIKTWVTDDDPAISVAMGPHTIGEALVLQKSKVLHLFASSSSHSEIGICCVRKVSAVNEASTVVIHSKPRCRDQGSAELLIDATTFSPDVLMEFMRQMQAQVDKEDCFKHSASGNEFFPSTVVNAGPTVGVVSDPLDAAKGAEASVRSSDGRQVLAIKDGALLHVMASPSATVPGLGMGTADQGSGLCGGAAWLDRYDFSHADTDAQHTSLQFTIPFAYISKIGSTPHGDLRIIVSGDWEPLIVRAECFPIHLLGGFFDKLHSKVRIAKHGNPVHADENTGKTAAREQKENSVVVELEALHGKSVESTAGLKSDSATKIKDNIIQESHYHMDGSDGALMAVSLEYLVLVLSSSPLSPKAVELKEIVSLHQLSASELQFCNKNGENLMTIPVMEFSESKLSDFFERLYLAVVKAGGMPQFGDTSAEGSARRILMLEEELRSEETKPDVGLEDRTEEMQSEGTDNHAESAHSQDTEEILKQSVIVDEAESGAMDEVEGDKINLSDKGQTELVRISEVLMQVATHIRTMAENMGEEVSQHAPMPCPSPATDDGKLYGVCNAQQLPSPTRALVCQLLRERTIDICT